MPRSSTRRRRTLIRCCIAAVSVVALVTTAFGWTSLHGTFGGITVSQALETDAPRSTGGAMNILLIGLDSRKDLHGNELPQEVLDQLHAGDSDVGGYNTNTLILLHVGADDKVVAFSIPRDDYVAFNGVPGYNHIKIKEAYGLTKAYVAQKLVDQGVGDQEELETAGREAGRKATLRAVRNLTGAPIDYFAEVNLASFYDLAQSLGGIEVCLKHAVHDEYSGADFPAGRQTLNAAQALAFVRQRHGLENGDLDRTHRQQAFLLSVMHQLQQSGSFTDIGKLSGLMDVARKDIVLSAGWGEEQFKRMAALAGGDVEFRTLPVVRYENIGGQDVNIVDPAAIRAEVATAFGMAPTSTAPLGMTAAQFNPATVVDVVNASSTTGIAGEVSKTLTSRGFTAGAVRDPYWGEPTVTAVDYGTGAETDAKGIADLLGIDSAGQADATVADNHVRVVLGDDFIMPTSEMLSGYTTSSTVATTTTSAPNGWLADSTTPTPDAGRPVDGGDGVPCVN
ncbi:MAG: LCP family protein [Mycobacterium sp.]|nr:LCP family protein [Mycobacterium sp.]